MTRIDLTDDEAAMLREVCENARAELRTEIAHTDSRDFRTGLRRKEVFLKELLERLAVVHVN